MNFGGLRLLTFLLLALQALACQRFAHRFASIQTVCGVPRSPATHYIEFYSSQGERLERADIIIDSDMEISAKGCLLVSDDAPARTMIVRHRLHSEGIALRTDALLEENPLVSFSLRSFPYKTPEKLCHGSLILNAEALTLFQASAGLQPDAWQVHWDDTPASAIHHEGSEARIPLQNVKDGSYTIAGELREIFSPEQRRHSFRCDLVIDRRPPQFSFTRTLRASQEWVASPGQSLRFPLDGQEEGTHIALCVQGEDGSCRYQTLSGGSWVAPARGIYQVQVKAIDAAGNESEAVPLTIRLYDESKIAGLRSELELIQRLLQEQNGAAARNHMRSVLKTQGSLGTQEEKKVLQKDIDATLFAVHLSPEEQRFPKSEGSYLNWFTQNGRHVLLFHSPGFLILRDEEGREQQRFTVDPTAKISSRACMEGLDRSLLLRIADDIVQIKSDHLQTVAQGFTLDDWEATGSCRYRKYQPQAGSEWYVLDLLDPENPWTVAREHLWILRPNGRPARMLTLHEGVYASQNLDGADVREHPELQGLTLDKILPDARVLMLKKDGTRSLAELQVFQERNGSFVPESSGGLQVNANDASGNRSGSQVTLYRALDVAGPQWYAHHAAEPQYFRRLDLPTTVNPEAIELGQDIIVTDGSVVPGLLDLNVYHHQGTLLTTLRFTDASQNRPSLAGVIGNRLLLNREDAWVLLNPWPHRRLESARGPSRLGMQWGPFWDDQGAAYQFTRVPVQTQQSSVILETLAGPQGHLISTYPAASTKALNRLVEKPLAVWQKGFAFLQNQKSLRFTRDDGQLETAALPGVADWLRVDVDANAQQLLLMNRSGQIFKKSLHSVEAAAELLLPNVWAGCAETLSRKALDYAPGANLYATIACQKIFVQGQPITLDRALNGTLMGLQVSADGRHLLVWTSESAYLLAQDQQQWTVQQTLHTGLKNDPLVLARWNQDRSLLLLSSRSGRLFLARVHEGQTLEIRFPQGRPLTLDDMHFDAGSQNVILLAPEGRLEFPLALSTIMDELCSSAERNKACD